MNDKKRKILVIVILFSSMMTSTLSFYVYSIIKSPNILVDKNDRYIYIEPNTSFNTLRDSLVKQHVVNDLMSFAFLSKFMKYQEHVKPGRYLMKKNMNNIDAIRLLRSGVQDPINVRFSNARFVSDLATKLTTGISADSSKMLELLSNDSLPDRFGFTKENFISMFLPNTYQILWLTDEEKVLSRMKKEYDSFWDSKRLEKAKAIGLTPLEVSTLASIVDAETAMSDEKPKVAGVYINRLRKRMKLQADPTLIFGMGDFTIKRVLDKHKEIDSPYNTYRHYGLPPGPIRLPSISGIDAVLNFVDHDYIYFCAQEDFSGYHNFEKTYSAHLRNAGKYYTALNKKKIYR